jgi:hypothetical protein
MSVYEQQWRRVQRYSAKLEGINRGVQGNTGITGDHCEDEFYSFFMHCYHLKDWLKNDASFRKASQVESYISATPCLTLCADLCNSIKHLVLDRQPRSGTAPGLGDRSIGVHDGGPLDNVVFYKFIIQHNGPKDAYAVATECVKAWEAFLQPAPLPAGSS